MSASTVFVSNDNSLYSCPKHGVTTSKPVEGCLIIGRAIDRTPILSVSCGPENIHGNYCLICYAEWINATFPRLTLVEPKT